MYDMHELTNVQLDYLKRNFKPIANVHLIGNKLRADFVTKDTKGVIEVTLDPVMNTYLAFTYTDDGQTYGIKADTITQALHTSLSVLEHSKVKELEHDQLASIE